MPLERLTTEDIDSLVREMLDLISLYPKLPFVQLFSQAQASVLPEEKRYAKSVVVQRTKWSKKLQDALKNAGLWPGYEPEATKPTEMPTPSGPYSLLAERPPEAPVPAPALPAIAAPQDPTSVLLSQLYNSIRSDLRSSLMDEMRSEIDTQVRLQLRSALVSAEELESMADIGGRVSLRQMIDSTEIAVSIPRVFVVGLLPEQTLILRRKLLGVPVDLRFWKNDATTKLYDNTAWADYVFIMSKFVSHSTIHAITSKDKGRDKIKYANGAVSDLERQIRHLIQPEQQQAAA